jgi:peptidoglycan lytic transglycosylase
MKPRTNIAMLACAAACGAVAWSPAAGAQAPATPEAGATLAADPCALAGRVTRFRGALPDVPAGGTVQIQRLDPTAGWVNEATAVAGTGGTFLARWRPKVVGRFTVRAITPGSQVQAAAAAPTAPVTVYRAARTTWYGPGFYGHTTACGFVLSHRIMGVAHRTLPCGTPVELYLGGRTVVVPVIDRGPFSNAAHYDLTSATAQALGLTETTTVGVVPNRGTTMVPPLAAPLPGAGTGGTTLPAAPAGA